MNVRQVVALALIVAAVSFAWGGVSGWFLRAPGSVDSAWHQRIIDATLEAEAEGCSVAVKVGRAPFAERAEFERSLDLLIGEFGSMMDLVQHRVVEGPSDLIGVVVGGSCP